MKKNLLLLFIYSLAANAQFGEQVVISTTTERPQFVKPFDIDNDGFMDILSASGEDFKLTWYKNVDGLGSFGPKIILNTISNAYLNIQFVDIDGDEDKDLLYLVNNPKRIAWLENLDGAGNFSPEQVIIENQPNFIININANDIDIDGDLDLVVTYTDTFNGWVVWYENVDGQGNFSEETLLIQNNTELLGPYLIDIDNDGLLDILTSHESYYPSKIVWHKNLGGVQFGEAQEIYQFDYRFSDWTSLYDLKLVDINSDNKIDIVVTANHEDFGTLIKWLENLDNDGSYGLPQTILVENRGYNFFDLDNDNDLDFLLWNNYNNILSWMENEDGQGNFSEERIITSEIDFPTYATATDLNDDGYLDVISASIADDKLAWYPNNILGIENNFQTKTLVFPNPTTGLIKFYTSLSISQVEVYNLLGQKITEALNTNELNISTLEIGMYLVKIKNAKGIEQVFRILKE